MVEENKIELISRIDKKIVEDRFNYILNRDILKNEVLDNNESPGMERIKKDK